MWLIFSDGTTFLLFVINILETHYKTSNIIRESADWVEKCELNLLGTSLPT